MNKTGKILLGIMLAIICFGLSAFGMYEYNNYKVFNDLVSEGNQYMIQKNYDKAIQSFQQALSHKNDTGIQTNLVMAENLKNENNSKEIISKNIQLATDAAQSSKYDEANKYLDEVLKIDPNNSEVKSLKDTFVKAVKTQQELQKQQEEVKTTKQGNETELIAINEYRKVYPNGLKYNEALAIAKKKYPGCSFTLADEIIGRGGLKEFVPMDIVDNSFIFYGHNDTYDDEFQGLIVVNKKTGKLYWFINGELRDP